MSKSDTAAPLTTSPVLWYGLSILSVAIALAVTFLLQPYVFRTLLFFLAIMVSTWLGGTGPGLLAVLLSTLSISFVLNPQGVVPTRFHDVPNFVAFLVTALLVGSWSAARRRAEQALRRARACGGEATFEGIPGQGSTVRLRLPRLGAHGESEPN